MYLAKHQVLIFLVVCAAIQFCPRHQKIQNKCREYIFAKKDKVVIISVFLTNYRSTLLYCCKKKHILVLHNPYRSPIQNKSYSIDTPPPFSLLPSPPPPGCFQGQQEWRSPSARMVDVSRVQKELTECNRDSDVSGVSISLHDGGSSITHLTGTIAGPLDTPYQGGIFRIDIRLPGHRLATSFLPRAFLWRFPFRPPPLLRDSLRDLAAIGARGLAVGLGGPRGTVDSGRVLSAPP
jgi:hypothetical protein